MWRRRLRCGCRLRVSEDAVCGRDCGGRSFHRCHHAVGEAARQHSQQAELLRPGMFVQVAVVLPQRSRSWQPR
jgi:hypothetical protein